MLNRSFINRLIKLNFQRNIYTSVIATLLLCGVLHNRVTILACWASWKEYFLQNMYLTVIL